MLNIRDQCTRQCPLTLIQQHIFCCVICTYYYSISDNITGSMWMLFKNYCLQLLKLFLRVQLLEIFSCLRNFWLNRAGQRTQLCISFSYSLQVNDKFIKWNKWTIGCLQSIMLTTLLGSMVYLLTYWNMESSDRMHIKQVFWRDR